MNIVDRKIVLSLNGGWQAIGVKTVADAFVSMTGGNADNPPVKALDITYNLNSDGSYDFDTPPNIRAVTWLEWISLPIREGDLVVNTSHSKIRVPTAVVAVNFHKMPTKRAHANKLTLFKLQGERCGYTGEKIPFKRGNVEHVKPRSHGGKDTFDNLLFVKEEINSKRGNKPLEDLGLKPLFKHKQPAPVPVSYSIKELAHPDWRWFLDLS